MLAYRRYYANTQLYKIIPDYCFSIYNVSVFYSQRVYSAMKFLIVIFAIFGCALAGELLFPGTTLIRSPEHDSAIIRSDRVGAAFAYSSVEGHAYRAVTPIVRDVYRPFVVTRAASYPNLRFPFYPGLF